MVDTAQLVGSNNVIIQHFSVPPDRIQSQRLLLPPKLVPTLYGRGELFTHILQLVQTDQPVVLHGIAGIGKSALASSVAWALIATYPNGVLWIDGGYNPVDAICDTIGQQLEDEQMAKLSPPAKPSRVRYLLGNHKVLVVLDNCWDSDVAREFAQKCVPASNSLLVTSREKIARLGNLIEVPPLNVASGVELFRDTSLIPFPREEQQVIELVNLLGGHPQGLVIAGALCLEEELTSEEILHMLGPSEIRTQKLALGKDATNNVWATFDLSYQRLRPEEQIIFKYLGGSWSKSATVEMLSFIVDADLRTIESALKGLVKRALGRVEDFKDGHKRYVLENLIHSFAQSLLRQSNRSIEEVHSEWMRAAVAYSTSKKEDNFNNHLALELELGNLLGAATWAAENNEDNALLTLAEALCIQSNFLYRSGFNIQAVGLLTKAIDAAMRIGDIGLEGTLKGNLGYAYALLSDYDLALENYKNALAIAQTTKNLLNESKWIGLMGFAYDNLGQLSEAIKCFERAMLIEKSLNNKVEQGRWLGSLAGTYRTIGEDEKALRLYTEAIALARRIGDLPNECIHLSNLGNAYRSWGKYEKSIEYYDQAFDIAVKVGDRATQARSLINSGRILARLEKPEEGLERCKHGLEIFSEIGFKSGVAYAHGYIGEVLYALNKTEEAFQETLTALELHQQIDVLNGQGDWLHNLGVWSLKIGNHKAGVTYLQEALKIRKEIGVSKVGDTEKALMEAR